MCNALWVSRSFPPVDLSTRVDRSRGLQAEEMVSSCLWLLSVSKMAYFLHFILVSLCAS